MEDGIREWAFNSKKVVISIFLKNDFHEGDFKRVVVNEDLKEKLTHSEMMFKAGELLVKDYF